MVPNLVGTVLLAEDGEYNQTLIRAYIEPTQAQLTIVGDGEQALERALSSDFDLVLMDIQMPVMDGVTAIKLLRQTGYGGPIVALTANVMQHDIEQYREAGCDDVLGKPIDTERLYAVLARFVPAADSFTNGAVSPTAADLALANVRDALRTRFTDGLTVQLDEIELCLANQQWSRVRHLTHTIKGIAASVGYPTLTELAKPIEPAIDSRQFQLAAELAARLLVAGREALRNAASSDAPVNTATTTPVEARNAARSVAA